MRSPCGTISRLQRSYCARVSLLGGSQPRLNFGMGPRFWATLASWVADRKGRKTSEISLRCLGLQLQVACDG